MRKIYGTSAFKSGDEKIINEMKRLEYRTKRQLALKVSHKNRPHFYSVRKKLKNMNIFSNSDYLINFRLLVKLLARTI